MTPKLRRWIDLLAALLRRKYPVTLEERCKEVPGYPETDDAQGKAARRRMFERDKKELRDFGIPIATVAIEDKPGYALNRASFYLPYLELLKDGRKCTPRRPGRYGYHSLPSLCSEPDELAAMEMGDAVTGDPTARRFRVRRLDAFARWILGAGGAVVPLAPPELLTAFRAQVHAAQALYAGDAP